jgi:NADH dehydrogenase FAD-containing subunit
VLAAGSQPNFFGVPGAEEHTFPLYSATDANRPDPALRGLRGRRAHRLASTRVR